MPPIKIVMLGDIMGEPGLGIIEKHLPDFIDKEKPDFIMANGENSAGGFGINENAVKRMLQTGIDVISGGNHTWEKREVWPLLESEQRIIRPLNYPDGPGRGWTLIEKELDGKNSLKQKINFLAVNLQGREFMNPIDCPFKAFDNIGVNNPSPRINPKKKSIILVDFHAESSREKEALGFYLDGRACVVAGTHTHVQTTDEKILPKGTAYISDLGMTGILDAVIGIEPDICVDRVTQQIHFRMEAASKGNITRIQGIVVEIDEESFKAVSIKRLNF